jgi:hypothetical protein
MQVVQDRVQWRDFEHGHESTSTIKDGGLMELLNDYHLLKNVCSVK